MVPDVDPHTLLEIVDGHTGTSWECKCGKSGISGTRKGAADGHRSHVRRANKA